MFCFKLPSYSFTVLSESGHTDQWLDERSKADVNDSFRCTKLLFLYSFAVLSLDYR